LVGINNRQLRVTLGMSGHPRVYICYLKTLGFRSRIQRMHSIDATHSFSRIRNSYIPNWVKWLYKHEEYRINMI
jgi:hypothetical protein